MYIKNGERYQNETDCPDFGSVTLVEAFHERGANKYLFKDADKEKLGLLNLAGDGSLAYCTDKKYWLIKHDEEWVEA